MPFYYNQIKCIYIDPPYNTGKEGWKYNDNVNSPIIKKWLKETVGPEGEDLCRHDKWLCMMYPRLTLLKDLLSEDGIIFISLDNNEVHNGRSILDEIFGGRNFLGTIIWRNVTDNNPTNIAIEHEYIHCYSKNKDSLDSVWKSKLSDAKNILIEIGNKLIKECSNQEELQEAYTEWFRENKQYLGQLDRYKYIDSGGVYTGSQSVHNPGKEGYRYDVIHPITKKPSKQPLMGYRFPKSTMDKLISDGKILFGKDEDKIVELKLYAKEYVDKLPSVITMDGRLGVYDLRAVISEEVKSFNNPKPVELIKLLLSYCTKDEDIILDSFAGSGTTGQAVLELNKEDGFNRKFILVELEEHIAKNITAKRLKRVIEKNNVTNTGFEYLDLNGVLYDYSGYVNPDAQYEDMAAYIYFTETKDYLDLSKIKNPYIGAQGSTNYFLFFKEKDKNILDEKSLRETASYKGSKVIYADKCLIDEEDLAKQGVIFKQIPYELKKY
ncbi:hypothetical protein A2631_02280 [Candidatus Daviesbacteria bacterium RIFCSPHIGHO2_01_FULL_44_29]|uniref:DNA methylase N-4/N-6 domain-containing protein n=1 Tax=Candidatus Daviesbacteria bacterium RIFCSPHIGHO2_02_FULL_43_12 TaxID=1797776 RepID=A0A1F5KKG6_9BACT|nr:MAG: hypothetical protein A2631_02280 [Candidatus Daviesbacteria bacterium RIFCSPHIGHO2_01_FULL_44_29]OGE41007.1 MAG: hypothetical protein A3E86_03675 [Candidatus Daviesbacteria bacterium RIFCSPHIGHO2_12_FULL_47_45]OGE41426.1 MAG: hypothetical protein A3D25_01675 [Candidatus Daviesbacteria bacterium RIFCSPHIGHO2_02_FULL_43_12]OGE69626.1 MAG: hypothetical protein A3B55_03415 [Candidatus Daviesbacteria bacterium RIFCSPLOWO2_01_FULL_43_15]